MLCSWSRLMRADVRFSVAGYPLNRPYRPLVSLDVAEFPLGRAEEG
jgi:hypothetical protein